MMYGVAMEVSAVVWNSLEITKLAVEALVPLSIFVLGGVVERRSQLLEQTIWKAQKGIEWKQSLFDRTIGGFNKLFCAFNYIGNWRNLSPQEIIETKRALDVEIYGYRMLLSPETVTAYNKLSDVAFSTFRGRGLQMQIRANVSMYAGSAHDWNDSYREMFVPDAEHVKRRDFNSAYENFMSLYFGDVGLRGEIKSTDAREL